MKVLKVLSSNLAAGTLCSVYIGWTSSAGLFPVFLYCTVQSSGTCFAITSRLQCAGMNRHEAEDERALRVKTSDLLGPESCADTARDSVKRRQGLGEVGIQLRKDAIRTPPSL